MNRPRKLAPTAPPWVLDGSFEHAAGQAMRRWALHHETCPDCGLHDWYTPGFPRPLAPEDEAYADFALYGKHRKLARRAVGPDGVVWVDRDLNPLPKRQTPQAYAANRDPSVLCQAGRKLFTAWEAATVYRGGWRSHSPPARGYVEPKRRRRRSKGLASSL